MEQFLREAVYYPASGLDGAPVKFLSKRFSRFFYADYSIERAAFDNERERFRGYRCRAIDNLDVETVFGCSWDDIYNAYRNVFEQLHFEWSHPFVAAAHFERLPDLSEDHGPAQVELIFARCEAIATYLSVFSRRGIAPRCLAYIRAGIGFGGNYSDFPQKLERALRGNPGGLPEFILYDGLGGNEQNGDYLSLVRAYDPIQRWDYRTEGYGKGNVTLGKLRTDRERRWDPY